MAESTFYFTIKTKVLAEGSHYSLKLLLNIVKNLREKIKDNLYIVKYGIRLHDDYIYLQCGFDRPHDVLKTLEDIKAASFHDACIYNCIDDIKAKQSTLAMQEEVCCV